MNYPTLLAVELAGRYEICQWYRFLPSPVGDEQEKVMQLICKKFKELGGFTPAISKAIGWKNEHDTR